MFVRLLGYYFSRPQFILGKDGLEAAIRLEEKFGTEKQPINFVFHGGSGSSQDEIREAIGYGAIKMNIDTDLQWGFTTGVRDYFLANGDYVKTQIGNPEGDEKPNKKYYDPRAWIRAGEITFKERLIRSFKDLNNTNTNI